MLSHTQNLDVKLLCVKHVCVYICMCEVNRGLYSWKKRNAGWGEKVIEYL